MAKQDDYVRYTIRVPRELYGRLELAANEANRSVNAEIVDRLGYAVEHPPEVMRSLESQITNLNNEIESMELDLKQQANHIENLTGINSELRRLVSNNSELEKSIIYHILSYVDQVPDDLILWAYQMALIFGRIEIEDNVSSIEVATAEDKNKIRSLRNQYRDDLMKKMKLLLEAKAADIKR